MYNVIMQCSNSFLSCSIRNLTLASLSLLFYNKNCFFPFVQVLIPTVVFFHESNRTILQLTVDILAGNIVYTIARYEGLQST